VVFGVRDQTWVKKVGTGAVWGLEVGTSVRVFPAKGGQSRVQRGGGAVG